MSSDFDQTIPEGPWKFDENVTKVFDNMLERSIPGYLDMRSLTTSLAVKYAQPGTSIVDLGCSRGGSLIPIIEALSREHNFIGVEISEAMRNSCIEALSNYDNLNFEILDLDLRETYPTGSASVVLSILTIQFIPIEYRQEILARAFDSLVPGGAIILVEKILGFDAHMNRTFVDLYYQLKGENGYTEEQINTKRKALEGVLVPVTASWNEQLLQESGFKHIDCFWRNLNFAGWIGVKDK
jgi:tRNA (cmo5U34)-methyltransferase